MFKRILFFAYGIFSYVIFLGVFLYAIGFIGNFGVPKTLDGAATGPLGISLAIDVGLLALFAVQHSVMARKWFKDAWTKIVPKPIERSTYVLFSSVALIVLFTFWQPLGGVVWSIEDSIGRIVLRGLFAFGWALLLYSTTLINHLDLFGMRQVWRYLRGQSEPAMQFVTPGPYRLVRHPLYVGWLLAFWMTPLMTFAHLLFSVATTAYILLAIRFEERDLVRADGTAYEQHRKAVPMLVPSLRKRGSKQASSVNASERLR